MSNLSNLIAAIDRIIDDGDLYNAIIHGPASGTGSIVTTDNGPVKTLARIQDEFENNISTSILTLLGIPSYANLTAANAALTIGSPYFDTTLNKLQIATA